MLKYLAMSLLLSKTAPFTPIRYPAAQALFKNQACRLFAANNQQFHNRYIEMLGNSPYQEKISHLFNQETISVNDTSITHFYLNSPDDTWMQQFEQRKAKFLNSISGSSQGIRSFEDLLKKSVSHSLEVLASKIDLNENLPVRISIRTEAPKKQVLSKPQWHSDVSSFHLLINLFSEHCTLYHGPANGGDSFAEYFNLTDKTLEIDEVVEAPAGEYVFSSQGVKPVYHASPIKAHNGRVALVIQVGPTPPFDQLGGEAEIKDRINREP